jgi:hypothetical protein
MGSHLCPTLEAHEGPKVDQPCNHVILHAGARVTSRRQPDHMATRRHLPMERHVRRSACDCPFGHIGALPVSGHNACAQRQIRLTHTTVTGRPPWAGPAPSSAAGHAARVLHRNSGSPPDRRSLRPPAPTRRPAPTRPAPQSRHAQHHCCRTTLSFLLGLPSPCPDTTIRRPQAHFQAKWKIVSSPAHHAQVRRAGYRGEST